MFVRTIFILLISVSLCHTLYAETVPEFGASIHTQASEQPLKMSSLRGKLVVLFFVKSITAQGNEWAPDLIKTLEQQKNKNAGIVLVGIKGDHGTPENAVEFLKAYGATTDEWIIATDTKGIYQKKVTATEGVWTYALISPAGEVGDSGDASTFYLGTDPKEFAIIEKINAMYQLVADTIVMHVPNSGMDPILKRASFLAETGRIISAIKLLQENEAVGGAQVLAQQMMPIFDTQLATALQTAENENAPNRFEAFMTFRDMVEAAKDFPQIKPARTTLLQLKRDSAFRDELRAEEKWHTFQKQLLKVPEDKREEVMLREIPGFVKKYPGTYYAELAQALLIPTIDTNSASNHP